MGVSCEVNAVEPNRTVSLPFQPTLLGFTFLFEEDSEAMITDEDEDRIFVESDYFTGWMSKATFFESLGTEE